MRKHLHVGVLDSDPLTHELIPAMLDEEYSFHLFSSEPQLNQYLETGSLDLIICETELEGADARKICENNDMKIPLVFISSRDRDQERRKCFYKIDEGYLTKPFTSEELHAAVDYYLNAQ